MCPGWKLGRASRLEAGPGVPAGSWAGCPSWELGRVSRLGAGLGVPAEGPGWELGRATPSPSLCTAPATTLTRTPAPQKMTQSRRCVAGHGPVAIILGGSRAALRGCV